MGMKDLLEERQEQDRDAAIAEALGISLDDLDQLNWTIDDHASEDGVIYGHNIYFGEGSDPEILQKIGGLNDGRWVRIGPL